MACFGRSCFGSVINNPLYTELSPEDKKTYDEIMDYLNGSKLPLKEYIKEKAYEGYYKQMDEYNREVKDWGENIHHSGQSYPIPPSRPSKKPYDNYYHNLLHLMSAQKGGKRKSNKRRKGSGRKSRKR